MGNIDKGGQEGVIYEGRCARGKEHDKMGLRRSSWLILSSPASPVLVTRKMGRRWEDQCLPQARATVYTLI